MTLGTGLPAVAETIEPPTHWLRKANHVVAVVEALGAEQEDRFRFRVLEELSGETSGEISVRLSGELAAATHPESKYILGYTTLIKNRRDRRFYQDPGGARILEIALVGEALLPDTAEIRRLLLPIVVDSPEDGRERLEAILAQLERPDPIGRRLVLADLVLWPELSDRLTETDAERLRVVFDADSSEHRIQEYVLTILLRQAERFGREWLAQSSRQVLEAHEPEIDLKTYASGLLVVAMESLRQVGGSEDAALAEKYIVTNNPTVGRIAMQAFVALDPDLAERELPMILWEDLLGSDARRVASAFLRDLRAARQD